MVCVVGVLRIICSVCVREFIFVIFIFKICIRFEIAIAVFVS